MHIKLVHGNADVPIATSIDTAKHTVLFETMLEISYEFDIK
jgi:hypothetical protein